MKKNLWYVVAVLVLIGMIVFAFLIFPGPWLEGYFQDLQSEAIFEQIIATPTNSPTQTSTPAPQQNTATPTLEPTLTPSATATLAPNWDFTAPGAPETLPTELRGDIAPIAPPENCAQANDLNQTCSTRQGQSSDGGFTLNANTGIRLTGDKIYVSQMGSPLMSFYDPGVKQTMWFVANTSTAPITNLHLTAEYGHFRGFFTANWDVSKIEHMLGLGLYQFIASNNPLPTPAPVGPTPVVNCGSSTACESSNVNVAIWDGATWHLTVGFYTEGQAPYWQQK